MTLGAAASWDPPSDLPAERVPKLEAQRLAGAALGPFWTLGVRKMELGGSSLGQEHQWLVEGNQSGQTKKRESR